MLSPGEHQGFIPESIRVAVPLAIGFFYGGQSTFGGHLGELRGVQVLLQFFLGILYRRGLGDGVVEVDV